MADHDPGSVAAQLYERFQSGDIDSVLDLLDPDATWELVGPTEIPYFGRYRGRDDVERFFGLLGEHCVVEAFGVDRITPTADGAVAEGFERGHFAGKSVSYDMRWCHVMTIADGRIQRFVDYLDTSPMLAAWRS
ncbi:MAG: nuclear transport factor 2 family protein [Actinomycetota bacterium]